MFSKRPRELAAAASPLSLCVGGNDWKMEVRPVGSGSHLVYMHLPHLREIPQPCDPDLDRLLNLKNFLLFIGSLTRPIAFVSALPREHSKTRRYVSVATEKKRERETNSWKGN